MTEKTSASLKDIADLPSFEMVEAYESHFNGFLTQLCSLKSVIDPFLSALDMDSGATVKELLSKNNLEDEKLENISKQIGEAHFFGQLFQRINQNYQDEKSLLISNHYRELNNIKQENQQLKEALYQHKAAFDELKYTSEIRSNQLLDKINNMEINLEESKSALKEQLDTATETIKEEKILKKKIENWVQRRFEALKYSLEDLKNNSSDDKKFNKILGKVERLKYRQPWNRKRPGLEIDMDAVNSVKDNNSSGTETPFSHYVCFLSSAASEDNTINQAFIVSGENSMQVSQNNSMNHRSLDDLATNRRDLVDLVIKKLNDSNIPLDDKEQAFCNAIKDQNNISQDQELVHVNLEDIMNVASQKNNRTIQEGGGGDCGGESISFEFKGSIQNPNNQNFTKKVVKLGDLKDSGLAKLLSPMFSSIHGNSISISKNKKKIIEGDQSNISNNNNNDNNILEHDKIDNFFSDLPIPPKEFSNNLAKDFGLSEIISKQEQKQQHQQNIPKSGGANEIITPSKGGTLNLFNNDFSQINITNSLIQDSKMMEQKETLDLGSGAIPEILAASSSKQQEIENNVLNTPQAQVQNRGNQVQDNLAIHNNPPSHENKSSISLTKFDDFATVELSGEKDCDRALSHISISENLIESNRGDNTTIQQNNSDFLLNKNTIEQQDKSKQASNVLPLSSFRNQLLKGGGSSNNNSNNNTNRSNKRRQSLGKCNNGVGSSIFANESNQDQSQTPHQANNQSTISNDFQHLLDQSDEARQKSSRLSQIAKQSHKIQKQQQINNENQLRVVDNHQIIRSLDNKNIAIDVIKDQNNDDELNISEIEKKKIDSSNILEKMPSKLSATADSFLGDDDIKNFLNEAKDSAFKFDDAPSNNLLPQNTDGPEPRPSAEDNDQQRDVVSDIDNQENQIEIQDLSREPKGSNNIIQSKIDAIKENENKSFNEKDSFDLMKDNIHNNSKNDSKIDIDGNNNLRKSTETVRSTQPKIINENLDSSFARKNNVPLLDFTRISKNVINITFVESSINQSSMIEPKAFDDFDDDDEDGNKKTEKPSEKQQFILNDDSRIAINDSINSGTHKTPVKFQNPRYLDEITQNIIQNDDAANINNILKPHISNPSADFNPRPPQGPGPRRSMQLRPNLIDEIKPNIGTNSSFDHGKMGASKQGNNGVGVNLGFGYDAQNVGNFNRNTNNSMQYSFQHDNSFDISSLIQKESKRKNNRNSRSVQLQRGASSQDQKENEQTHKKQSSAVMALETLIGKPSASTQHQRKKTEISPLPQQNLVGLSKQPHQSKQHSLSLIPNIGFLNNQQQRQNLSQMISNNQFSQQNAFHHQHHTSSPNPQTTTIQENQQQQQQMPTNSQNISLNGSENIKKILTYEDSKIYPTPNKPLKKEFHRRRAPNENSNFLNLGKEPQDFNNKSFHSIITPSNGSAVPQLASINTALSKQKSPYSGSMELNQNEPFNTNNQDQSFTNSQFRSKRFNIKKA